MLIFATFAMRRFVERLLLWMRCNVPSPHVLVSHLEFWPSEGGGEIILWTTCKWLCYPCFDWPRSILHTRISSCAVIIHPYNISYYNLQLLNVVIVYETLRCCISVLFTCLATQCRLFCKSSKRWEHFTNFFQRLIKKKPTLVNQIRILKHV